MSRVSTLRLRSRCSSRSPYLWLDQDEIYEEHDKVMLDIFVAEPAAVLADRQADVVATRLVAGS